MGKNFKKNKENKFSKGKFDNFSRRSEGFQRPDPIRGNIEAITPAEKDKVFVLTGIIDRIEQTGGPTIFHISDGTGTLALKAFEGAGIRAYPELNVGDAITTTVTIQEYNNELEGEVSILKKLIESEKSELNKKVAQLERKRAEVKDIPFLVDDVILHKLKDRFIKAATEIRLAIIQNRPIIIRHHNDTDGYSSGYSLERAVLPLIVKQHNSVKSAWEFYTRSPVAAPMYEIDDSIRDTAHSLLRAAKFSNKMPLVLIVDTGSGEKDLLGIQQGRVHDMDFIVVDHHAFDKDLISKETLVHINPFLVGEEGTKFSAGMLCTELARFINPDPDLNIIQIPAMAGLADKVDNEKAMKEYFRLAQEKGYSRELLSDISTVIDFVSAKLRFMEAREYIEVLFGEPMEKQKALVSLLAPYIRNLEKKGLDIAKAHAKKEKINSVTLQTLEIESTFARGFYPRPGISVSLLHDYSNSGEKIDKLVTIGLMSDAITLRATSATNFSVQEFMIYLEKNFADSFPEGGGHKFAGSIRFLPSKQKEVLGALKDYIKSLK